MDILHLETIKENFRKDRLMFAIRIIVGVIFSIQVANKLGIDFASSTGVVTLLTIDETKKDTFRRVILRILSFIYTYLYSWMTVDLLHLDATTGFTLAITLVTLTTFLFRWDLTLSVNCVILIQLFLSNKPFTRALFFNESGRLLIGIISAILVNFIFRARYDDTHQNLKEAIAQKESKLDFKKVNKDKNSPET